MTSRRRRLILAGTTIVFAIVLTTTVLLAVDVYLHGRYERSAGLNVWGYRGPSVGRKKANEYRVVMLGGSAAYGYGVTFDQAIPAQLEQLLRKQTQSPAFTVVNLGYNNEGAYSFRTTLEDYAWLHYDLALLYEGYNDISDVRPNTQIFRHDSPVFRLTGYLPIFPIIFKEKAAAMTSGNPGALYRDNPKTVFHASLAAKTGATVLTTTADVAKALEAQLGRVAAEPPPHAEDGAHTGCERWSQYCRSIERAAEFARRNGAQVMVATQPYLRLDETLQALHMQQQSALREFLMRRFGNDRDVKYVNLGDAVDLENTHLSFDHMHLRAEGNTRVASRLVEPVLEMAALRTHKIQ
jgi:lysophospholipase L1-like esterase